jgi:hypothetical protein
VIDKIQAVLDSNPNLESSYPSLFNTITEYKTAFTASLATYKTKREGYQADYNGNCVTTTTTTTTTISSTGTTTTTAGAGTTISTSIEKVSTTRPTTDQTTTPYTLTTTATGNVVTSHPERNIKLSKHLKTQL